MGENLQDYHKYYFASSLEGGGITAIGLGLMVIIITFYYGKKIRKK